MQHLPSPWVSTVDSRNEHREFLNQYYGYYRKVYDLTRKYYLFGRDRILGELLKENWATVVDVGVGTGRNLKKLQQARPSARFGGIDASDEMLTHTRERYPWAELQHGFAEDVNLTQVLGARPERVLFSYTLSMVGDPAAAIRNAQKHLAPGGKVKVVDFADLGGLPGPLRRALLAFLGQYHVHPVDPSRYSDLGGRLRFGPFRYYLMAEFDAMD